jgi:hypothetical protein
MDVTDIKSKMTIQAKAKEHDKKFFPVRDCSLCGYMMGYVVLSHDFKNVGLDTGCDCVTYTNVNQSSWDEVERFYSSHSEEGQKELNKLWWGE